MKKTGQILGYDTRQLRFATQHDPGLLIYQSCIHVEDPVVCTTAYLLHHRQLMNPAAEADITTYKHYTNLIKQQELTITSQNKTLQLNKDN